MRNAPGFLAENEARAKRWEHMTSNTEGQTEYAKAALETLLDNIDEHLNEKQRQSGQMEDASTTGNIATFSRLAKPITKRVQVGLIANDLVSVQPMTLPDYRVFFMDFVFGSDRSPTVKGDRLDYAALKQNSLYSAGIITDETAGTGNASTTIFNTKLWPVVAGSVTATVAGVSAAITSVNTDTGAVTMTAAPANGATVKLSYSLVMEGLGTAGNATIPDLKISMSSANVFAESQKLMSSWTFETEQDLRSYHGEEMVDLMGAQVARELTFEIDRRIIAELLAGASAGNTNWSKAVPSGVLAKDHYETLFHAIEDSATLIYKKRLVYPTWVVMGPDSANFLTKTLTFRPVGDKAITLSAGPNVFGSLGGRYKVVVDPLFPSTKILLGYKGSDWSETGYVFSPYTLFQSQVFIDPQEMVPRMGMAQRGARYLVSGDFYATVTVTA